MDEVKREERKNKKLADIKKAFDDQCPPCEQGVLLRTARDVCKTADLLFNRGICDQLHEKAVLEEITITDYLHRVRGLCSKDSSAKTVIQALIDSLDV